MLDNGEFLRGAADAGELRVNPAAASDAVAKLAKVRDRLQILLQNVGASTGVELLQLGANPVGIAMAKKTATKADGAESLHAALQKLYTQADNAHYAVTKSMQNYDYTDESGALRFKPQH